MLQTVYGIAALLLEIQVPQIHIDMSDLEPAQAGSKAISNVKFISVLPAEVL